MDPFTHGLAGALIGKAFFSQAGARRSEDLALRGDSHARVRGHAWAPVLLVTLGALFPDADVVFSVLSSSNVATLEYHRWITHSLICLPVFALALAAGTQWVMRQREKRGRDRANAKAESRGSKEGTLQLGRSEESRTEENQRHDEDAFGWSGLAGLARLMLWFSVGIASHIFLDVITSWGTMTLAPVSHERTAWDWVFIIDGALTALLLLPQLLAWIYADERAEAKRRAIALMGMTGGAIALQQVSRAAGISFGWGALAAVIAALAIVLFGPAIGGWGARVSRAQWSRAGVALTCAYLLACFAAQRVALGRVEEFARREQLAAQRVGALPLPPSLLHWGGLVRTSAGVYQTTFSLLDRTPPRFEFVADRATPESIEAATNLPEVQTYLWFARFPVVETREVAGQRVMVFTDQRFVWRLASAPAPFEYWVVFDTRGNVTRHGWASILR